MKNKFLYWLPRILGLLFIGFLAIFAFDVFDSSVSLWQAIGAFLIHLIPNFVMLAILIFAWKKEFWGGILFLAAGLAMIFLAREIGRLVIPIPLALIGLLFILNKKYNNLKNMENQPIKSTGCCPPFDPEPWQDKEISWDNKIFIKDRVHSIFHIPLDIGKKVLKNMVLMKAVGAEPVVPLMLFDENSLWGADIYIDAAKEVPGAQMAKISGKFLTKVFEGPFKDVGKWAKEMKKYVEGQGRVMKKLYFSYTTCPRCAKAYGKNYVVLFGEIE